MTPQWWLLPMPPLVGALVLALMPGARTASTRWIANLASMAVVCLAAPLSWEVAPPYSLGVDGFSAPLLLLTAIMGALVMLASWSAAIPRPRRFFATLLVLQAALLGAFAVRDSLLFLVCWQAALAATYVLMRGWNNGEAAARASATRFLIHAGIGGAATLAAIVIIYRDGGATAGLRTFDIDVLQTLNIAFSPQWWAFLLLFAGLALAVPLFPLGRWLAAKDVPVAVPVMLVTVVFTVGLYGFIRIALPVLPDAARWFSPFLSAVAAAGILYGAGMALRQREWAPTLAYVSLSQMATALLGVLVLNSVALTGGMVQTMTQTLSVGGLLLLGVAGGAPLLSHADDGAAMVAPRRTALVRFMTLASTCVPVSGGFVAVFLVLQGTLSAHPGWAGAAAAGALMASASLLRLPLDADSSGRMAGSRDRRDLGPRELALLAPLVLATLALGLYPAPLLDRLALPVRRVVGRVSPDQPATAADCDTTVTPAMKAANPAAQFLEAAPCGPDGLPLPATSGSHP